MSFKPSPPQSHQQCGPETDSTWRKPHECRTYGPRRHVTRTRSCLNITMASIDPPALASHEVKFRALCVCVTERESKTSRPNCFFFFFFWEVICRSLGVSSPNKDSSPNILRLSFWSAAAILGAAMQLAFWSKERARFVLKSVGLAPHTVNGQYAWGMTRSMTRMMTTCRT